MRRRFVRRTARPMRGIVRPGIPPLLLRASHLLAGAEYLRTADGLEELAQGSEGRGGRRAPQLHLEAGRVRLLAGQKPAGMALLDRGLKLMAASGASPHLARAGRWVTAELMGRGLVHEAEEIRLSLVAMGAPPAELSGAARAVEVRSALPPQCSGCGAPAHPDEVEWLDDISAECEYCGSTMRPE